MDLLQVIAEPTRRRIIGLVWEQERAAGAIAAEFDTTFGAVSQHLRILREAGAVVVRREGTRRYYLANRAVVGSLAAEVATMWAGGLDRLAALAEAESRNAPPAAGEQGPTNGG